MKPVHRYNAETLRDILEWDVPSWAHALDFWEGHVGDVREATVLDIGARGGGLSLYFALKGALVTCSDYGSAPSDASRLHERYNVADRVTYAAIDATQIDRPDASFDIVCFKSVLGGIGGARGRLDHGRQEQAMREMHRVLKPGGRLFFAENLTASALHDWMRRRFVRWAHGWRYLAPSEMDALVSMFDRSVLGYWGFFATLGRSEGQRRLLHALDVATAPLIPRRSRYIVYGCCWK